MIATLVKARVRPGKKPELLEFLKWDGQVARDEEPGTLRFDVFEDARDENVVYWYEAYVDKAAFDAHRENPPFREFVGRVRDECIEFMEPVIEPWSVAAWPSAE